MLSIAQHGKREYDFRKEQLAGMGFGSIYAALYQNYTQQLQLQNYYAYKQVGAVSSFSDLFASDDSKAVLSTTKMTNVAQGKLDADKLFLLTHIQLLFGNASNLNETSWGRLSESILNGTIKITQDDRVILDTQLCRIFDSVNAALATGDTNAAAGTAVTYTIQHVGPGIVEVAPKFILPQKSINVDLKFAKALSSNDNIGIVLYGVQNVNL